MNRRQPFDARGHGDLSPIVFVVQDAPVRARAEGKQRMLHRSQIILRHRIKDIAEEIRPLSFGGIASGLA